MPVISGTTAPVFNQHHATFVGLASPSRGATETSVWRVILASGAPAVEHFLDREEVLVVTGGRAIVSLGGAAHDVATGDAIVVPPGEPFSLANPYDGPLEAIAVLPVGGKGCLPGGAPFTPPWAE